MILQPLVENACVHGLEAIEDKRLVGICVTADFTKNMLYLQVEDNGGGMTAEKLEALKVSFQENDEKRKKCWSEKCISKIVIILWGSYDI